MPAAEIRVAVPDDIPAIRSILTAHGNDGPVAAVDVVGPYVAHLVRHHRALVSSISDDVVAFGAVVDAGVAVHLADLFVRPHLLGRGIGRPLLTALFDDARFRTTFASDDPRALPLYVRAGMAPLWVCLYVEGAATSLPPTPATIDLQAAGPGRLAELELAWTGVDRATDHAFWASQGEADSFVVAADGEPVAIVHARARQAVPVRIVDRLLVRPGADPVAPTLAALRRAARGGSIQAFLQGPSPVLRVLLDLGFVVRDRDQFMASAPGLVDPARLIANPGML
jgi:GNAT superfamily N-acetyltransferase